ncbi:MAG: YeeE/YedE family protein, partial [candidate division NC10 bacterium]|nr:YeeE/YedE family protein [candidate division NC10 bacterium]
MGPLEITGTARLILGLVTGIAFGFILEKGQVARFDKIVNALRFKDLTIVKVMVMGILTGMVGVYSMYGLGLVNLHIKPTILPANILGG